MTRYAIGDIHGGAKTFRALLQKINLRREDRVYLLGDYVDRGPDSKGVLDTILKLMELGYDVRPVRGNHDDMFYRNATGNHDHFSEYWMEGWGEEALKSFNVKRAIDVPFRYVTFIESMPYIRCDDQFVYVHAGLDMTTADPIQESSPMSMTWWETGAVDVTRLGGRRLVTGHEIRPLPLIEISLTSTHILLDNGAFTNQQPDLGNLVALNLDSMSLTIQPWIDVPLQQAGATCGAESNQEQEHIPLIQETSTMNLLTDETKAARMARVIMDNIAQYNPDLVRQGILEDSIFDLLDDRIAEGRREFDRMVSPDLDRKKLFDAALVDVLIKRAYKYKVKV